MCGGVVTKHKEHKCRFAVVFVINVLGRLDVTEYVADLVSFGSDFFFLSLTLTE